MDEKRGMDTFGAATLIAFAMLLAVNQVVVKLTGDGFGPVFQAGLRSALGFVVLLIWTLWRGVPFSMSRSMLIWGAINGVIFAIEFVCLFVALDLTTVSRASIIFYSMPVWLALAGHFWLPGERLSGLRILGLLLAMGGVAVAMADRSGGQASLVGDVLALIGALFWAGIALVMRLSPLSRAVPELQMLVVVGVSTPVLLGLSPLFGDLLRDPGLVHLAGLAFQAVFVVSLGYLLWAWLITIYKTSAVASFSFLTPVLSVILGWWILDEHIGPMVWAALGMVVTGVFLINRRTASPPS